MRIQKEWELLHRGTAGKEQDEGRLKAGGLPGSQTSELNVTPAGLLHALSLPGCRDATNLSVVSLFQPTPANGTNASEAQQLAEQAAQSNELVIVSGFLHFLS